MTVAYFMPDTNTVRVIVKGAPEFLIPLCIKSVDANGNEESLNDANFVLDEVSNIAKKGQKPFLYAYRDF